MHIYDKFIFLCNQKGVDEVTAYKEIPINKGTISLWRTAKKNGEEKIPSIKIAMKMSNYFDIPVAFIVGWDDAVSDLHSLGMSELDVAQEMGIDPAVLNKFLSANDSSSVDVVSKFVRVASLLAKNKKPTTQEGSELNLSDMELLSAFKRSDEATQELIRRVLGLK